MRLIDADELMEHVYRDKLDSRELIADMVNNAPTVMDVLVSTEAKKECKELKAQIECLNRQNEKINEENCTEYDTGHIFGIDFAMSSLSTLSSAQLENERPTVKEREME